MPSPFARPADAPVASRPPLQERYARVRALSASLAAPLSAEDQTAQSMPDASPTKWHLAHTTWFFETFVLAPATGLEPFDTDFGFLFNSYYEALGPRQPRPQRGLLTRPSVAAVMAYRRHVDTAMDRLLADDRLEDGLKALVLLGLNHEEQHQELLLTDILHLFAQSPLEPAYAKGPVATAPADGRPGGAFVGFEGGLCEIGASSGDAFVFDNEGPRHQVFLAPYQLADRLTTNGEWLDFIMDGGYERPELWLSEGWTLAKEAGWRAPLYWRCVEGAWSAFSLWGRRPLELAAPVTHVSYYEADAYARWKGARLPTEAEWEHAAGIRPSSGAFLDPSVLRPRPAGSGDALRQLFGDCWEWTASPYVAYPGFKPPSGAVGEYNGKFMINQMVLRGGSCVTPPGHVRATYRNFFHPHQRWQFSGVRLAADGPVRKATTPVVDAAFRQDVLDGLLSPQKALPSKYFYDKAGSLLFEAICELEEYYPTRVETALLRSIASELAAALPAGGALVEFGSGSSVKTRILLDAAQALGAYAPIDISANAVKPAADAIARDYPGLAVEPVVGDFTRTVRLPLALQGLEKIGFFPGSTIGNFAPEGAAGFLESVRLLLGPGARFIVGVDLVKSREVLVAAYDDAAGVTADFNMNLLTRINRELGGDFDLGTFAHRALWNESESRIEMHLVSRRAQSVRVAGREIRFAEGETIHTENSYKYEPDRFSELARGAGWITERVWISPSPQFAVFLLRA